MHRPRSSSCVFKCSFGTRPPRLHQQLRPTCPVPSLPHRHMSHVTAEKSRGKVTRAPPPARRAPGAQILFHPPCPERPSGAGWRAPPALPTPATAGETQRLFVGRPRPAWSALGRVKSLVRLMTSHTINSAPRPREPGARPEGASCHAQGKINGVSMNEHAGPRLRKRGPSPQGSREAHTCRVSDHWAGAGTAAAATPGFFPSPPG